MNSINVCHRKSCWIIAVLALTIPITFPNHIDADIVTYSDVGGASVTFENIFEVSAGSSPMFGQPTAIADQLNIPTTGFNASANESLVFRQGMIEMNIYAKPGNLINSLDVREFGTFFNFGPISTSIVNTSVFVVANGDIHSANDLFSATGPGAGNWEQSMSFMFAETDQVRLIVDSQILAFAGDDSVAFIDKVGLEINVGSISSVPEPEMVTGMASLTLAALLFVRRRKKQPVL